MYARADLTAADSTLIIDSPSERLSKVCLQYISGGAGTVIVEGIASEAAADDVSANWIQLKLTKANDLSAVDNLAAAGLAYAENVYAKVRARKSVGGASCVVILGVNYY